MPLLNPIINSVPSESTIEQLSNHWLMNLLGPCRSWFYVPTKNEEKFLGYDASLQEYKALAIQYKRLKPTLNVGSITIKMAQHHVLLSNFPQKSVPYVFYAFSKYQEYSEIQNIYTKGRGIKFCREMVFFDVHAISPKRKNTSISYSFLINNGIATYNLFQIAKYFTACTVGVRYQEVDSYPSDYDFRNSTRVNLLVGKV